MYYDVLKAFAMWYVTEHDEDDGFATIVAQYVTYDAARDDVIRRHDALRERAAEEEKMWKELEERRKAWQASKKADRADLYTLAQGGMSPAFAAWARKMLGWKE